MAIFDATGYFRVIFPVSISSMTNWVAWTHRDMASQPGIIVFKGVETMGTEV